MVREVGLEPTASAFQVQHSTRLSYTLLILAGEARLERATNRFKVCYSTIKLLPNKSCAGLSLLVTVNLTVWTDLMSVCLWCPMRDSNPHAEALVPKTSVSTNSTNWALFWSRVGEFNHRPQSLHGLHINLLLTRPNIHIPIHNHQTSLIHVF